MPVSLDYALAVSTVDLARIQFAMTSLYHFLFVPLTLGLAPLVAIMQTLWYRSGDEAWLRLTRFFGTLMLINFAIGVATGLVQEFQFGMNWSVYSRFVGNVFGAPLAIEWNEACLQTQFWGVMKGAKNAENAQRFIDFACQPEIQANVAKNIPYGQSNRLAFKSIPPDVQARLPNSPEHRPKAFLMNGKWWADNRAKVSERWSQWLLQKS